MELTSERLIDIINDTSEWQASSYSGRAMLGKLCVAVTVDRGDAFRLVAEMVKYTPADDLDDIVELMAHARTDEMGLDIVIYWPKMKWPEGSPK